MSGGNPNHDPKNGEFASKSGGSSSAHPVPSTGHSGHRIRNTLIGALAGSAILPVVGTIAGGIIGFRSGAPEHDGSDTSQNVHDTVAKHKKGKV